jgi:hypothetical protein
MMTVDPRLTPTGDQLGVVYLLQRLGQQRMIKMEHDMLIRRMKRDEPLLEGEAAEFIEEVRSTCSTDIWSAMTSVEHFAMGLRALDVWVVWEEARKAANAADTRLVYLDFRRLHTLKMTDATWRTFFRDYLSTMERLWIRGVSAEHLLEGFFAAHFVMACRGSIQLSVAVEAVIDMKKWPAVRTLVKTWTGDMQAHERQLKSCSSRAAMDREGRGMSSLKKKGALGPAIIVSL